jgi:hypothetical protein
LAVPLLLSPTDGHIGAGRVVGLTRSLLCLSHSPCNACRVTQSRISFATLRRHVSDSPLYDAGRQHSDRALLCTQSHVPPQHIGQQNGGGQPLCIHVSCLDSLWFAVSYHTYLCAFLSASTLFCCLYCLSMLWLSCPLLQSSLD